jgi:hypothetical protein
MMAELQDQAIRQHCKPLRMPTIGTQFSRLADAAAGQPDHPRSNGVGGERGGSEWRDHEGRRWQHAFP